MVAVVLVLMYWPGPGEHQVCLEINSDCPPAHCDALALCTVNLRPKQFYMSNEHDTLAAIKQYLDAELLTWVMWLGNENVEKVFRLNVQL